MVYSINNEATSYSCFVLLKMDSYYDYNECLQDWLYEMAEDAEAREEPEEEHPSLSARERNPNLS